MFSGKYAGKRLASLQLTGELRKISYKMPWKEKFFKRHFTSK